MIVRDEIILSEFPKEEINKYFKDGEYLLEEEYTKIYGYPFDKENEEVSGKIMLFREMSKNDDWNVLIEDIIDFLAKDNKLNYKFNHYVTCLYIPANEFELIIKVFKYLKIKFQNKIFYYKLDFQTIFDIKYKERNYIYKSTALRKINENEFKTIYEELFEKQYKKTSAVVQGSKIIKKQTKQLLFNFNEDKKDDQIESVKTNVLNSIWSETKKIIIDVETGKPKRGSESVTSFSAILLDKDDNTIDIIDRYYFLKDGDYHWKNIEVNGLDEDSISQKRSDVNYSKYFSNDIDIINLFNLDIETYIAHNAAFDYAHIDINIPKEKIYCTSQNGRKYGFLDKRGRVKAMNLQEGKDLFKIDDSKIGGNHHESLYDTKLCYKIYKKMIDDEVPVNPVLIKDIDNSKDYFIFGREHFGSLNFQDEVNIAIERYGKENVFKDSFGHIAILNRIYPL